MTAWAQLTTALDELADLRGQLNEARVAERTARFYWLCRTKLLQTERRGHAANVIELIGGWTVIHWLHDQKAISIYSSIDSARAALSSDGAFVFVLDDIAAKVVDPEQRASHLDEPLLPSERAALRLLRDGLTNGEIASQLKLSTSTIKARVSRVYRKLGSSVQGRTQAALYTRDWNLDDRNEGGE